MFTCARYRNTSIIVGLFVILSGGCATKQSVTTEPQKTSQEIPVLAPLPPMSEIIELFMQHPHTVFKLATQSHSMYVGGELTAQFDTQKALFNIVADDNSVTCQYSQMGKLAPPNAEAKQEEVKSHEGYCENLVRTLYTALTE